MDTLEEMALHYTKTSMCNDVSQAIKKFAEQIRDRIEEDKYKIMEEYDENEKRDSEYYNLGLKHAQIIIDYFIQEMEND